MLWYGHQTHYLEKEKQNIVTYARSGNKKQGPAT